MEPRTPSVTPVDARNGKRVREAAVPPQGVYLPNNNVLTPADALARVRADVHRRGDHARRDGRQDAPLRLHALPEPAAHLSRRLPRQLRLLRPRAPPRGGPRLRRPQLHPRGLAGRAGGRHRRARGARRRGEPVPPHVHLDDHASALGRGHGRGAEGVDLAHRSRDDPGVDPLQPDHHGARGRAAAARTSAPTSSPWRSTPRRRRSSTARAARACSRRTSGRSTGRSCCDARDIFGPQKFGAHIIVGMGETEHEVLSLVQQLVDLGGHSHMFCFFPEQGSLMDHLPATPRDQWRRVQLARYLIDYAGVRVEQMTFDDDGPRDRFRPARRRARRGGRARASRSAPRAARASSATTCPPATGPTATRRRATSRATRSSRTSGTSGRSAASSRSPSCEG